MTLPLNIAVLTLGDGPYDPGWWACEDAAAANCRNGSWPAERHLRTSGMHGSAVESHRNAVNQ
ncbi:hypothetical protein GCM10020367_70530 [Streptomyces sannanensis]|uniref:Uncharacterized protein n=1 Tax=Streptomyces sannanensis TaxID=285536 RepID=A0ABP6SP17_9ACTN